MLDVFEKNSLKSLTGDVRNSLSANLPKISVKDSLYNGFAAMRTALLHKAPLAILVHVLREAADERFIGLKFRVWPTHLRRRAKDVEPNERLRSAVRKL